MRFNLITTSALALSLCLSNGAFAQDATAEAAPAESPVEYNVDTVLARVGDTEITLGHVVVMVAKLPDQYAQLPDQQLLEGIVQQLVEQQLLKNALEDEGPLSKGIQLSVENEIRALLAQELANVAFQQDVSEEEILAGYEEAMKTVPEEPEFNASHILVETEAEALELIETLNGGADFAELAKEKSTGPSGPKGGELGWFGPGQMVPEFDTAVQEMETGAISAPIQTQFGWHVIKLNENRTKPKPELDTLREAIVDKLRRDKVDAQIAELKAAAAPEVLIEDFPASAIRDMSIFSKE